MITFHHKGSFSNIEKWPKDTTRNRRIHQILEKHAKAGVEALKAATPVDGGKTQASWGYTIEVSDGV